MGSLDGFRRQLEVKVSRVADQVAREVEAELVRSAPVDSGQLRSFITAQVQATATGAVIDIESRAEYAAFVRSHRQAWDQTMRRLPQMIQRTWNATP